jgi:hypothetical protein
VERLTALAELPPRVGEGRARSVAFLVLPPTGRTPTGRESAARNLTLVSSQQGKSPRRDGPLINGRCLITNEPFVRKFSIDRPSELAFRSAFRTFLLIAGCSAVPRSEPVSPDTKRQKVNEAHEKRIYNLALRSMRCKESI